MKETNNTAFERWWVDKAGDAYPRTTIEMRSARDAWHEATKRCAKIAEEACLVPPDGGSPTEEEVAVCKEAKRRILSYNAEAQVRRSA